MDMLLDETLKPWLLEVNISPSLHSPSPLSLVVKGPMLRDLLNMAGYQVPSKLHITQEEEILSTFGLMDKKIPWNKHSLYQQNCTREQHLANILKNLTLDDMRHLIQSEDELTQAGRFLKIFPTTTTHIYITNSLSCLMLGKLSTVNIGKKVLNSLNLCAYRRHT
jgi:tubulin polyglutamylase TTLL4